MSSSITHQLRILVGVKSEPKDRVNGPNSAPASVITCFSVNGK